MQLNPMKRTAPRYRYLDALILWVMCLRAGGRCQHDMLVSGKVCRCPNGHDGSHITWRLF